MARPARPSEWLAFGHRWRQWTAIVELFARRKASRLKVDPEEYRALYQTLLRKAQTLESTAEGQDRDLMRGLQETVEPWLSIEAFRRADLLILLSLVEACHVAGRRLGGERESAGWLGKALLPLGLLAVVTTAVLTGAFWPPVEKVWKELRGRAGPLGVTLRALGDEYKVFLGGLVLVGLAVFLVTRIRRSG